MIGKRGRIPRPWFRKDTNSWFVVLSGKRHNLGSNHAVALRKFENLVADSVDGGRTEIAETVENMPCPSCRRLKKRLKNKVS